MTDISLLVRTTAGNGPNGTWRQRLFRGTLGVVKGDFGSRLAHDLTAPELSCEGYDRMLDVAQQIQVAVGVIALLAVWAFPGPTQTDRLTVTALLLLVYLPWTVIGRKTALLSRGSVARIANLTADLLAIGQFALVIPSTRVAVMFAYVLVIAFHSYVSGRRAGLVMTAAILSLVGAAEYLAPPAPQGSPRRGSR
jgi:hypothetical protein